MPSFSADADIYLMARLVDTLLRFTGRLGGLIAYRRPDSDEIFVRTRGGVSRERLKHSPVYAIVRLRNAEFGGRAKASHWIIKATGPLRVLGGQDLSGRLNALVDTIQKEDRESRLGERRLLFSVHAGLLAGFSLHRHRLFDAVVRTSPTWVLSRETRTAQLVLPPLRPGSNFFPPDFPYYRLQAAWGIVPDLFFDRDAYRPVSIGEFDVAPAFAETPWRSTTVVAAAETLSLRLPPSPDVHHCLMLTVGICFGVMGGHGVEKQHHTGSAKIVALT